MADELNANEARYAEEMAEERHQARYRDRIAEEHKRRSEMNNEEDEPCEHSLEDASVAND
jgi:hypothetical protein